jgi:hypothetical protein
MSLDFFHAYDRVSLSWVDKVMEAMGFGAIFRGWMSKLHRGASAAFLLRRISPFMAILFSIRQGDSLAALLFIIYLEPFLVRLEANLRGLQLAHVREASFGHMDDVGMLGVATCLTSSQWTTSPWPLRQPREPFSTETGRPSSWVLGPGQAARTGLFHGYKLLPSSRCLGLTFTPTS